MCPRMLYVTLALDLKQHHDAVYCFIDFSEMPGLTPSGYSFHSTHSSIRERASTAV